MRLNPGGLHFTVILMRFLVHQTRKNAGCAGAGAAQVCPHKWGVVPLSRGVCGA